MKWRCGKNTIDLSFPITMGIVNITPDSFSDGGANFATDDAVAFSRRLIGDGAGIVDIGGESTRPGCVAVSAEDECARILPSVARLEDAIVSVDTYHAFTARKAIENGASIVNNVEPLKGVDDPVAVLAAETGAGLVLMHHSRDGKNSPKEVAENLEKQIGYALDAGCSIGQLAIDPGFGFSKTREEDLALLGEMKFFSSIAPVLAGISRKRTLDYILGKMGVAKCESPKDRLGASVAAAMWCAANGASVLRVHDVKETVQALAVARMLNGYGKEK